MAVLTRPLFHSQERIDLEDLNQLQSGLRTDARLWTRQVYADKNFIVKGFDVSGLGTDSLTVNLLDSTLLFAGKQDLEGSAQFTVIGTPTALVTITLNNSVSANTVVLTEGTDWDRSTTNTAQTAANLAAAIDANGNFSATAIGDIISITALNVNFTTIVASDQTGFTGTSGTLSTFVYPTDLQESPADLSYFIIESDATGADARISRAISASERAAVGTASKTLFVYGTLVTEQNTPITKAFWDPSANSGAGAEFNQRVNTAIDLSIDLLVRESELDTTTAENAALFFANVPICEIEVDTSGIILSIRDTRPILFEADDTREWNRTNAFATVTMANTTATPITGVTINNGLVPNGTSFVTDEDVNFTSLNATNIVATARIQVGGTLMGDNAVVLFDKFDLATIGARQSIAQGVTSGAVRVVNMVNSNFFRDDKDLGNWRNAFSALATEIRNAKGTQRWYDDPEGSIKDVLRFINSTIIGLEPNARYEWNASGVTPGTLSIKLDPINDTDNPTTLTLNSNNSIINDSTVVFANSGGNVTLTAITSGSPSSVQYLVGSDSEATASNIAGAINGSGFPNLSATFAEVAGSPGTYLIDLGSNDRNYSTVTSNSANLVVSGSPFTYLDANTNLADIRFYGLDRRFLFREIDLLINANEVLFVTLPDLNVDLTTSDIIYNGTQFSYEVSGPDKNADNWNATNREIFVNDTDKFKTVPIENFESNSRNYWIAYRDNAETIFIRDVGELGNNESANIGQGITNATLSYIGAPDENDSTPEYPSVTAINAFTADGTYLAGNAADFNESIVAQAENLTSSISDLNNHLTEVRDIQYQNLGLKLIDGGFFTWETSSGTLSWSANAAIQVPGRPDNANSIATGSVTLALGQIAFVDINRNSSLSAALTPTPIAVDAFVPQRDRVVIARRINDFVFVGINGAIRLADSESAPLDSALQFIGLKNNELPKQLNTHISAAAAADPPTNPNALAAQSIDVGTSDVLFPVGGLNTAGVFDDNITLSLSINSGILFWEGITIDFINGRFYNEGSNPVVNFRGRTVADTTFVPATIPDDNEVYYAISLTGETAITAANRSTLDPGGVNIPATAIGRNAGEIDISVGTPSMTNATIPEFGGALPVAVIKVSRVGSSLQVLDADDLIVLGASGSGGGGTGDANQDLNNYLNRLNLSTFGYFTPLIAAISTSTDIELTNTDAGLAASGFTIKAEQRLTTTQLLDPEFTDDGLIPERLEVEGIFGVDNTGANIIDPNMRWFISFNSVDAVPAYNSATPPVLVPNGFTPITIADTNTVSGWIDSGGVLRGTNLTNITPNVANANIIFVENHGLSTGQIIKFPTGFDILAPAVPTGELPRTANSVFYVHVRNADAFDLHNTQVLADGADVNSRLALAGTAFGTVTQSRDAGIIPRVGVTNTLRGIFDSRNVTLNGLAYTNPDGSIRSGAEVRLALIGDADADTRSQPDNALLTSFAAFYADELGVEGVNPNGLDDVLDILRTSHLANTENELAGFQVPGRGIVLQDNSTGDPLLELAFNMGALSIRAADGTYQAIAARDAEGNLIVP